MPKKKTATKRTTKKKTVKKKEPAKKKSKVVPVGAVKRPAVKKKEPVSKKPTLSSKLGKTVSGGEKNGSNRAIMVTARAGTGKTTTAVNALVYLFDGPLALNSQDFAPSDQQRAIFEAMKQSFDGVSRTKTVMLAFNKAIAEELVSRVPSGVDAMTMHSLGYKAVRNQFGKLKAPSSWRTLECVAEIMGGDLKDIQGSKQAPLLYGIRDAVNLCKYNLIDGQDSDEVIRLLSFYGVETDCNLTELLEAVPKVMERTKNVRKCGRVDFSDMIWLPIVLDLPFEKTYDLAIVDEAQDLNRCQQALAKKVGKGLVFIGDDRQAIYGFAGADCDSLPRLKEELNCETYPLTRTYRCGKKIVELAREIVPDYEAAESNPDGEIIYTDMEKYAEFAQSGDMLLCRCNAPLVSQCFRFLKSDRKAYIRGRDIGAGLISLIDKMKADDIAELNMKLADWLGTEREKEAKKRYPNEDRLINLQDKFDCLQYFIAECNTVEGVKQKIDKVFSDDQGEGIMLSTIHKAKGLESTNVYLLEPERAPVPHPMAKTEWSRQQEMNLRYVAITRAITKLTLVGPAKKN